MSEMVPMLYGHLALRGTVTRTGWQPPEDMGFDEWTEAGHQLGRVDAAVQWWLGDWWRFGDRYGERVDIVNADSWQGPKWQTCHNIATVASKFADPSRRREGLTFHHHAEVAALDPVDADAALDWCEEPIVSKGKPHSTRELRARVARIRNTIGSAPGSDTCTTDDLNTLVDAGKKFGCIYADPPWLYDNQGTRAATGNHYGGMTVDEICELPIANLAAEDAQLHLWITNAFLFDAPRIFSAWGGFEFRTNFSWVKPQMGIGNYWRNSHELMLTAVRGNAKRFNDHSMMSWLECDRGAHSAKPEQVRHMVERASVGPYLELFGRIPVDGWTVWGNGIRRDIFYPNIPEVEEHQRPERRTRVAKATKPRTMDTGGIGVFCQDTLA